MVFFSKCFFNSDEQVKNRYNWVVKRVFLDDMFNDNEFYAFQTIRLSFIFHWEAVNHNWRSNSCSSWDIDIKIHIWNQKCNIFCFYKCILLSSLLSVSVIVFQWVCHDCSFWPLISFGILLDIFSKTTKYDYGSYNEWATASTSSLPSTLNWIQPDTQLLIYLSHTERKILLISL